MKRGVFVFNLHGEMSNWMSDNLLIFYQILMIMINVSLFSLEIVFAHTCHSLLLNIDAMFRMSQALLYIIQLASGKFFHQFTKKNTFGLGRMGLIAELINSIFLFAMLLSLFLEGVKHIIDNVLYGRLEAAEAKKALNATYVPVYRHQHYRIHRPEMMMWVGVVIVVLSLVQVSSFLLFKSIDSFNNRNRLLQRSENILSFKFAATASDIISRKDTILQLFCMLFGSFLVLSCGIIVTYLKNPFVHYADSFFAFILILNCVLMVLPIVREGIAVLLQNSPPYLSLSDIKSDILDKVADAVNVHDLHIWQHLPFSYVATLHVLFSTYENYENNMRIIGQILISKDIYHFTVQPEFLCYKSVSDGQKVCLISCPNGCDAATCCATNDEFNFLERDLKLEGNLKNASCNFYSSYSVRNSFVSVRRLNDAASNDSVQTFKSVESESSLPKN